MRSREPPGGPAWHRRVCNPYAHLGLESLSRDREHHKRRGPWASKIELRTSTLISGSVKFASCKSGDLAVISAVVQLEGLKYRNDSRGQLDCIYNGCYPILFLKMENRARELLPPNVNVL